MRYFRLEVFFWQDHQYSRVFGIFWVQVGLNGETSPNLIVLRRTLHAIPTQSADRIEGEDAAPKVLTCGLPIIVTAAARGNLSNG